MKQKGLVLAGVAMELAGLMLAAAGIGRSVEELYPAQGLWLVTLMIIAFGGWTYRLIFLLKRLK